MDVIKISFCSTNQNPVGLDHILDDASVKLTLFQPPTVVQAQNMPLSYLSYLVISYVVLRSTMLNCLFIIKQFFDF
jgi:hypothetical protein